MALSYSNNALNNQLDELVLLIDAGTAGLLKIYDSTGTGRPADPDTAVSTQVLLAELTMSLTSAPAASSGLLTFSTITPDSSADATGTATWFRVEDSAGNGIVDGDVGTSGSDLNLNSTSIGIGQNVDVTSFTITGGNA